jgi:hypothetical protein
VASANAARSSTSTAARSSRTSGSTGTAGGGEGRTASRSRSSSSVCSWNVASRPMADRSSRRLPRGTLADTDRDRIADGDLVADHLGVQYIVVEREGAAPVAGEAVRERR